jgi:hypothetical protein
VVTYKKSVALVMSHRTCYHIEVEEKRLRMLELLRAEDKRLYSLEAYRLDYEFDEYYIHFNNMINIRLIELCTN